MSFKDRRNLICLFTFSFSFCSSRRSGSGLHWFIVWRIFGTIEVFDSVGTSTAFLQEVLKNKIEGYCVYNITRVQSEDSDRCGEFCAYFVFNRFANLDLDLYELLNDIFEEDTKVNEAIVLKFLHDLPTQGLHSLSLN